MVEKPYCAPARSIVNLLEKYGVQIHGYKECVVTLTAEGVAKQLHTGKEMLDELMKPGATIPYAQRATFQVREGQAAWAEYLLWRTNKLIVTGGNIDGRNKGWGKRHGGNMPVSWEQKKRAQDAGLQPPKPGQPWVEKGCEKGIEAWEPIMRAKKARKS